MQGNQRTLLATIATILLANAVFAQDTPPVSAPVIISATPADASGLVNFIPSKVSEGTPPVREYMVSCESPGNTEAGIIETTAEVNALVGNSISIQGLTNGERYQCTMIGRSVRGGIIPRAINSEPSNPSPVFTPSPAGGPTIFVNASDAGVNASPAAEAALGAVLAELTPVAEATAAVEPPTAEAEPILDGERASPINDVPTDMPIIPTRSTPPPSPVEEQKEAPISSAVGAAASRAAVLAGVVAVVFMI